MKNSSGYCVVLLSPPSRWSGLKSLIVSTGASRFLVSTLAVEWIEIGQLQHEFVVELSLHPRGGVD